MALWPTRIVIFLFNVHKIPANFSLAQGLCVYICAKCYWEFSDLYTEAIYHLIVNIITIILFILLSSKCIYIFFSIYLRNKWTNISVNIFFSSSIYNLIYYRLVIWLTNNFLQFLSMLFAQNNSLKWSTLF